MRRWLVAVRLEAASGLEAGLDRLGEGTLLVVVVVVEDVAGDCLDGDCRQSSVESRRHEPAAGKTVGAGDPLGWVRCHKYGGPQGRLQVRKAVQNGRQLQRQGRS